MRDHRRLDAFQLAQTLVLRTYEVTSTFPHYELFGLVSQMRRCAVSTAANIVEGCARHSEKGYVRFLDCAFGSLRELGYFLDLASELDYLEKEISDDCANLQSRAAAALAALIRARRHT